MRRWILLPLLVLIGCSAPPLVTPPQPDAGNPCGENLCVYDSPTNKVDMLFVLDDGPGMSPMLAAWRASLPGMLDSLAATAAAGAPADYHFGVVTADLGAGTDTTQPSGCRLGGDGAKLRASADMTGGVPFIDLDQLTGLSNVPDVAAALDALSDVGSAGCDFRQPLEAGYRALHDNIPENFGFLRSDAYLVVVYVSNADDCSVPPISDLFDGSSAGEAKYGPLTRFRCTQFGISCNGAPVPATPVSLLTGCESQHMADGGKLLDVERYIDFFTKPAAQGGVKFDPDYVTLASVTAPADPIGVTIQSPCAGDSSVAMCPVLNHSCISPNDVTKFGDPAVRLRAVVAAAKHDVSDSICNADDNGVVSELLPLVQRGLPSPCLKKPVATRSDGTPDCVAERVTTQPDGSQDVSELPSCAENGDVAPCWRLVDLLAQYDAQGCTPLTTPPPPTCKLLPQCQPVVANGTRELYTVKVDWGAAGAPEVGTTSVVRCASP